MEPDSWLVYDSFSRSEEILTAQFATDILYKLKYLTTQLQPEQLAEHLNSHKDIDVKQKKPIKSTIDQPFQAFICLI